MKSPTIFITIIVSFSLSLFVKAQSNTKQIDKLIEISDSLLYSSLDNTDLYKKAEEIYKMSKASGYSRGELYGVYFLAANASYTNNKEDMIKYSFLAENLAKEQNNYYLLASTMLLKGMIYKDAELYDKAIDYANQGLEVCDKIKENDKRQFIKGKLLVLKAVCTSYSGVGERELLKLNLEAMRELKKAGKPFNFGYNYINIAHSYKELNRLDSAKYYFVKARTFAKRLFTLGIIYSNLTEIALKQNQYSKALEYNEKALDYLTKSREKDYYIISENYKNSIKIYDKLGNTEKVQESEALYKENRERMVDDNKIFKKSLLVQLLNKAEQAQEARQAEAQKKTKITLISISILIIITIIFVFYYRKQKRANRQNSELIENKEEKLSKLESKVNDAFAEVLELAKSDDPGFIPRFKEVYPEFYEKLTSKYPNLTIGQIRFCCMLRLNFSTKEIAHYHHLTIKGVQTRKNRLRKQLQISTDTDLNKWMLEIDQP